MYSDCDKSHEVKCGISHWRGHVSAQEVLDFGVFQILHFGLGILNLYHPVLPNKVTHTHLPKRVRIYHLSLCGQDSGHGLPRSSASGFLLCGSQGVGRGGWGSQLKAPWGKVCFQACVACWWNFSSSGSVGVRVSVPGEAPSLPCGSLQHDSLLPQSQQGSKSATRAEITVYVT